jgi:hypothetical protein
MYAMSTPNIDAHVAAAPQHPLIESVHCPQYGQAGG